ncbi:Acyl-protein synthetase, LuxE [Chryseobacterium taklimakanense]|uniref:Acyl-protein synthetase, LuxE n=1 Tax=Chryseobacterium taklimakanense TaxID=536441 RepID=A0A239XSH1_9FLAO|nr:acyl transferase [Chryseobacterium taklimakanense]SNV48974.1 Acyl-protein synthetase, LuxE [Chryseobacterium taklimakanense]
MFNNIFNIKSEVDFQEAALETFRYQYENVEVYRRFVNFLKISPDEVKEVENIPFLPIEMFKNQLVIDGNFKTERYFQSSGTTQMLNGSKHFIANFGLYEESIYRSFEQFIGKPEDYIFLGLLPNYSENPHSSLIYMVDYLMKKSGKPENGYFLYNHAELLELLKTLKGQKVILFGVSFALLDFLDFCQAEFSKTSHSPLHVFTDSIKIIETGGMKGRKEEITKDELLTILKNGYGTEQIFSEYSMTELLSQAYSLGENIYETPNWMRVLIRSTEDPFSYVKDGRNGAINIIDLANRHSCSFIATQDLGSVRELETKKSIHPAFSVAGRIDHSDIRGCSLLIS